MAVSGELAQTGLTEFGLLTSSGAMGSLLVYGYQKWLKKK
jgi:hypothetical protein